MLGCRIIWSCSTSTSMCPLSLPLVAFSFLGPFYVVSFAWNNFFLSCLSELFLFNFHNSVQSFLIQEHIIYLAKSTPFVISCYSVYNFPREHILVCNYMHTVCPPPCKLSTFKGGCHMCYLPFHIQHQEHSKRLSKHNCKLNI